MIREAYQAGLHFQRNIENIEYEIKKFNAPLDKSKFISLYLKLCIKYNIKNDNEFIINLLEGDSNIEDVLNSFKIGLVSKDETISFSEAAKQWGINRTTIQHAKKNGRLKDDEWEMIGRNLYVKVTAMNRLFGNKK